MMYFLKVMPTGMVTYYVNTANICSVEFSKTLQFFTIYLSSGEKLVCKYDGFQSSDVKECNLSACESLLRTIESGCLNP